LEDLLKCQHQYRSCLLSCYIFVEL
jgi:hypothetical protein